MFHFCMYNFSRNKLTELPSCVGRIKSLKSLHVEYNQLRQMPEDIGDLFFLEDLVNLIPDKLYSHHFCKSQFLVIFWAQFVVVLSLNQNLIRIFYLISLFIYRYINIFFILHTLYMQECQRCLEWTIRSVICLFQFTLLHIFTFSFSSKVKILGIDSCIVIMIV